MFQKSLVLARVSFVPLEVSRSFRDILGEPALIPPVTGQLLLTPSSKPRPVRHPSTVPSLAGQASQVDSISSLSL
ncbi:hypothetical protein KSS87_005093, partial [Heliosperma pusillum]